MTPNPLLTILTIDDEPLVRKSFRLYLEELGYRVIEAETGSKGLELASTEQPDLILLDLRMPEPDGIQTLKQLKMEHAEIPVIIISGTGETRDVVEALRQGAWDYLTKPITNLTVLAHAIDKALERAQLLSENLAYQSSLEVKVKKRTAELEEACRQLDTSNQTLEALFQAAPLAIILLDTQRHLTLWNRGAVQLFGWGAAEAEGSACPLFTNLDKNIWSAISRPGLHNHEQVLYNRDGSKQTLKISTAALYAPHSNAGGMIMLLEDVTEMMKLQTEADRANRLASLG